MMRIETGNTTDRRIRVLLFLLMSAVFSAYFAYDGYRGYPGKNLKWARQSLSNIPNMPEPQNLKTNPKVLKRALDGIARKLDATGTDRGKVTVADLTALFGPATFENGVDYCYIGPASFGWFKISNGQVDRAEMVRENTEPSESDIRGQKWFAFFTGVVALGALIHLVRITRMRWVLDDDGLYIGRRRISWDAMDSLDLTAFAKKGWLDLIYLDGGAKQRIRLDSYFIEKFDDIVAMICTRKGFASPLPSENASGDDSKP